MSPQKIEGWFVASQTISALLAGLAASLKFSGGAVVEIGVHHGASFIPIMQSALTHKVYAPFVAIDIFEEQSANLDRSGHGNRTIFQSHLDSRSLLDRVTVHSGSSLVLTPARLLRLTNSRRVALFSVDGCHTFECTLSDLELALATLHDYGIIVVDDYYNHIWPGVASATNSFLEQHKREVIGLAYGENKFYLSRVKAANMHIDVLLTKRCNVSSPVHIGKLWGEYCHNQEHTTQFHHSTQGRLIEIHSQLPDNPHLPLQSARERRMGQKVPSSFGNR